MANNDNAKLNVNIEGSENIVNSLNAIVASFSNFSRNLTSLANKVTKFNRDAAAIATGLKALKDASSGGKITRDQSRNPVNAILSLDTLKQTFATYKKYLKAEMRESIEMLLSQKSYGGSAKENNALISLIKNSAKAKKEYLRESRNFGAIVEKTESHFATIRKREEREIKNLEEAIKAGLGRIAAVRQKQAMSTNRAITGGGRDKVFDRMSSYYKSQDADLKASIQIANKLISWKEKENEKLQRLRNADLANSMKIGKEMLKWKEQEVEKTRTLNEKVNASRIKRSIEAITQKDPELISMAAFYKEQEKEAKKIQKLKESLMKQSSIDNSARIKKAVSSITEKDPELTAMAAFYKEQEKEAKKIQKLKESYDKNVTTSRVKKAVSAITEKDPELLAMRKFYKEQAREADRIAKLKEKDDLKRISSSSRSAEINLRKEQRAADEIRKKKEAELKRQSALSIRSQIVDRFKKMGAQPGQELDYTITGLSNFKEAASNTIDTVTERMKVFGMVGAGIIAGFVGIGVAIKNWGYEVILTTEKLRGYNIALLGSMKTQKDVNNLLKASEEITKDLPVGYEQMILATKALSLIAPLKPLLRDSEKSKKVLGDVWNIILGLSQIEPEWGISGAIFSLREALSGDLLSLKRRFEIPVDFVTTNEGKKISEVKNVPEKMLEGLSNFMSQSFGKEALEMTAKQFGAVLNKIENLYTKFKGTIGESGIYEYVVSDLQKVLDYFSTFSKSGAFNFLAKDTSDSLIAIYENVKKITIGFAQNLANIFGYASGDISQQFSVITDGLKEFNFYLKWMADYINSPQFQSWLVDFVNSGKKLFYDLSSSIQNAMYEAFQYVGTNAGSMYDSIVWVVNKVRELVGDKGLLALLVLGPTNVVSLISASFQTVNGLIIVSTGLVAELAAKIALMTGGFAASAASLAGWVAGLAGALFITKQHIDVLKGARNFWQYLGIGKTPEMKAQDKIDVFNERISSFNKQFAPALASIGERPLSYDDFKRTTENQQMGVEKLLAHLQEINDPKDATKIGDTRVRDIIKEIFPLIRQKAFDISNEDERLAQKASLDDAKAIAELEQQNKWLQAVSDAGNVSNDLLKQLIKISTDGVKGVVGSVVSQQKALETQKGISLGGVKDSVITAGQGLASFFKQEIGKDVQVSSAKRYGNQKSQHFTGDALDFSVRGMSAFDMSKFTRRDFLERLGSQAKETGVHVDFENSIEDASFSIDEMNEHIKEINQTLGGEYLKAWTNPKASASHIHMASMRGGTSSTNKPMISAPSPMGFRPDTKDVNYYFSQDNLKKAFAEYRGYLDGFNNSIFAVKKVISDGDELSASMVEDIRKQFQKDGGAKVGFERVEELKAALANLKAEKDSFSQVFGVIGQNVNNLLNELPKFINIPEGIFGTTFKGATGVISGYIAGGFKDQVGPLFQEILEKKFGEAENLIPGEIEKSIAVYRGQIRAALVTRDNTFVKLIPDVQQEIANKIITEYAETLPLIFNDKEMVDAVKNQLGRVREGLFAGKSFADAIQGSFAQFSVEALTKRMSQAPANDVVATMFAVAKDAEKTQGMMKVADALNEIFNSSKKAAVSLEETNKLYQKQIGSAKTMAELMQFRGKGNRATRSAFYGQYQTLLETEPQSNAFNMGIESSLSGFKNWSEQMFEIGAQLVTDLSGVFETNFFDALSGKFKNFADMFRGLGNAIKDMILKIIAKMAALSATKLILGVDISGEMGGGSSGFGGILNSIVGGGSGGGGLFGNIIGGLFGMGSSGAAKGISGGIVGGAGATGGSGFGGMLGGLASGAAGAKLAGTSGGIFGKASSLLGKAGKWITANPLLSAGILGAGMFLSQPGRLFGGAKDKTGPAQEQYAAASSSRDAMVKRRSEDAQNYYASSFSSNINKFAFGNIGYSTWTSGDGWFRGPKEKHAATDASAFNASMNNYYSLLITAASDHAYTMRGIDKLKEINEVAGLKREKDIKDRYLGMLRADYETARVASDFVKMDELRDKVIEAEMEMYRLSDDIIAAQINMAKSIKEGLKAAGENFVAALTGLKGTNYTSGNTAQLGSFYKMQQDIIKGGYISKENMAAFGANPNEISGLQAVKKYYGSWFNRKSTTLGYNYGEEGKADLLAALDEYVNNYLKQLRISNIQAQSKVNATDMFNNLNNTFVSPLMDIYTGMKDTKKMMDTLRGIPEATEEYYQVQFEYSEYQEKLSEQIKSWMNSGLISKDPTYWTAILNGPLDKLQSVFEQVASQVRFKDFKNTIFDAMKGFETNADFNNVVNMVKGAGGDASLYSGMTTGTDPWESWYNWSLDMIKTKMKNAQRGSEEFYAAQEELFRLMAEKADRQKQNAEEAYAKIEEALEKIGETMKVRVAEESKTTKGDTYFIDVGASRDATKQLEAMLAKINTNDPKAKELIEAFRKRIMGIRS